MKYHGSEPLTYSYSETISPGTIVQVPMRKSRSVGIVLRTVPKPTFTARPILTISAAPPIPEEALQLLFWLQNYYPAPLGTIVRQFLPPTTVLPKTDSTTTNISSLPRLTLPPLTAAQEQAIAQIQDPGYHLLHGVTGSGKTRVYQELASNTLAKGRSVLILTPEIGLTAQIAKSFEGLTPHPTRTLHSRLKPTERRQLWYEILSEKQPQIVIGPRSALFSPIANLGLIIIDESHDQSYKSDASPHYRSERVAAQLARLHKATLVSGTATPTVEEYYIAEQKKLPIVRMDSTALSVEQQPDLKLVDMREASNRTKSPLLSNSLIESMQKTITQSGQILLFLNRRGTASSILCNACGWQATCSHCDLPLTYHADKHTTLCHQCGRKEPMRLSCPECQNTEILLRSFGTKAVVDEVGKFFPDARIQRFDTDTHKTNQLEQTMADLQSGKVQILIGTQMLAKGLDLPRLALVGILNADAGLSLPDYTAAERTNYLLNQVAGRIGRGHSHAPTNTLIVQTYRPDNEIVLTGVQKAWKSFYNQELFERKSYAFPPFQFMLKLTCSRASSAAAERAAKQLAATLRSHKGLTIEGPAPAFYARENKKYLWNIIVKSSSRKNLVSVIRLLPSGWSYDLDPISML